eukprot:gene8285-21820_t
MQVKQDGIGIWAKSESLQLTAEEATGIAGGMGE